MTPFRPVNITVERSVLHTVFADDEAALIVSRLPPEYFGRRKHKALHCAIQEIIHAGQDVNVETLRRSLFKAGWWTDSPDENREMLCLDDIFEIQNDPAAPMPAQLKTYVGFLRDTYRQRRLFEAGREILTATSERFLTREEIEAAEEKLQRTAFEAVSNSDPQRGGLKPVSNILGETFDTLSDQTTNTRKGIRTGFKKLDEKIGGLQPSELTIVCGRPGSGKTGFALDVALHAAQQVPTAIFSLEMSILQLGQRISAKKANINLQRIRSGHLDDYDWTQLTNMLGGLDGTPLYIDDSPTLTPGQIKVKCREIAVRTGIKFDLIIVDYLQLMNPGRRFDTREREISSLSREMKLLAKDLDCSIILLSQLNRQLEQRKDKRPLLSDLRESGSIEQDADRVIALYQPFQYSGLDEDKNKAEAILLKQRNGPVGTVDLYWEPTTATFHDPM